MLRLSLLIPTHANDGTAFNAEQILSIETYMAALFGGFTLQGKVRGGWIAPDGRCVTEESVRYIVGLTSIAHGDKVGKIVRIICAVLGQHSVFVEYGTHVEVIVPADPPSEEEPAAVTWRSLPGHLVGTA